MIDLLLEIAKAWNDAGPVPEYHAMMQARLKYEWPTLADAVERLANSL